MQVAANRLSSLHASSSLPICCIVAEPGTVGGAAARWQVLAQALEQSSARQILSLLFLEPLPHAERLADSLLTADLRHKIRFHVIPADMSPVDDLYAYIDKCFKACAEAESFSGSTPAADPPILVIDSLESAAIQFGVANVLTTLHSLAADRKVSGMLFDMHSDLQPNNVLNFVHRLATCLVLLQPTSAIQSEVVQRASGGKVHTEAIACTMRHSGRPLVY